eukprot:760674-Alexandrium_andersonii.AAC.1
MCIRDSPSSSRAYGPEPPSRTWVAEAAQDEAMLEAAEAATFGVAPKAKAKKERRPKAAAEEPEDEALAPMSDGASA